MRGRWLATLAAAAAPLADGATQTVEPTAAEAGCELHVWPSERFQAHTQGWLAGVGLLGALADAVAQTDDNAAARTRLGAALDSSGQARALAALDLGRLLSLPGHEVVRHDQPVASDDVRARARHADSASPCYAELIVTRITFQQPAFSERSLRVAFLFRDFGDAASPGWTFSGRAGNELGVWPPQHPTEAPYAEAELVEVFQQDFADFARDLGEARRRAAPGRRR